MRTAAKRLPWLLVVCAVSAAAGSERPTLVAKWSRYEASFESSKTYANPVQEAGLRVTFRSPGGTMHPVGGFWDGGRHWKVRFAPNEIGEWSYQTACSDAQNRGLHGRAGRFICTAPAGRTRFEQHGPVRVSRDDRYLEHEDGTPFFWLGDTAWNGPLLSTEADWDVYVRERVRQQFTAVQWVTTQWRAAPEGNREHQLAFTGREKIVVQPEFFRRLDARAETLHHAGLLNVPVLLWAFNGGSNPQINPGVSLPDDQAILLARYLVARWQDQAVVWILNGDGDYRGPKAERWKKIGRGVFGDIAHAPVTLHPGGRMWVMEEFRDEPWLGLCGYQSGHNETEDNLKWIFSGPPAKDWKNEPHRPCLSLEAPYENHGQGGDKRISSLGVRRAHYWSLLNAPTAGVTYGGHGVWGWDDGTTTPTDHPKTGVPLPWRKALVMPAAGQMAHLAAFFNSIDFWRLRPAPEMVANQPGNLLPRKFIAAARTEQGDLAVCYVPEDRMVELRQDQLPRNFAASWFNPRTGGKGPVVAILTERTVKFATPAEGDWLLLLKGANPAER